MKSRGFSLAEVIIAAIFMGIIATLTIPASFDSLKYKEHATAYKNAFAKVKEVAAAAALTDSSTASEQKFWAMLNDSLPVIGYSIDGIQNGFIPRNGNVVKISASTLAERALWYKGNESDGTTIGSSTGSIVKLNGGYSPWIVTENGMAFTLRGFEESKASVGLSQDECGTVSNIFHAQPTGSTNLTNMAASKACITLLIDVNGLDKGPNTYPNYSAISQNDAYNEIKNSDRFHVFIGSDGVTAGPEGLPTYWLMKGK